MHAAQTWTFIGFSLACIIAPGPDNLSVVSYGISRGRRAGMLFAAGCSTGCLLHTLFAAVGISALVAASVMAFTVLKTAGALYLFYLAYQAFRSGGIGSLDESAEAKAPAAGRTYFRRGFLANAMNPKVALFFLAFLPQFTSPDGPSIPVQFLALGAGFSALSLVVFLAIGFFSGQVGALLRSHAGLGRWLDRFTGLIFVLLGLKLLFVELKPRIAT